MRSQNDPGALFRSPMAKAQRSVFEITAEMKKPTIAAVNGSAAADLRADL